jgi:TonB-linked SusC/RagA family outer membrane protein
MVKRFLFGSLVSVGAAAVIMAAGAGRAEAQAVIGGKVTGGPEQPLGGAVVVVRELGLAAATTTSGTYSLTVPQGLVHGQMVTLQVRYIGYKPETRRVTLDRGPQTQDFELASDPLMLNEVVVTGTAEATPTKELSFTVGAVNSQTLEQVPAVDPLHALEGKLAGVTVVTPTGQPGEGTVVRLRGATTLTPGASQQPLLIVDGVITQGTLADLNSEDIDRIEVVKGAAASSLYGSNAAAGVIQVFTKRGLQNADGVTTVTLRTEYGQQSLARRVPLNHSHYDSMAAGQLVLNSSGNPFIHPDHYMDQPYPADRPWRDQQSGIMTNGPYSTQYVAVSRRQGATNLQASFENQNNDGIVNFSACAKSAPVGSPPGTAPICSGTNLGYVRRNVRLNMDQGITDRLDVSVGGFYNESHNRLLGNGGAFFDVLFMPPDVDLKGSVNTNGEPFKVNIGLDGLVQSQQTRNPLYTATHVHNDQDRTRVQGSARVRWRPFEWLSIEGDFGYDRSQQNQRSYTPKGTLAFNATLSIGYLGITNTSDRSYNGQLSAAFQHTFGQLQARLKLAGTVEDETYSQDNANGSGFASLATPELSNIALQDTKGVGSYESIQRARNVFGVAGFTYRDRYIFDALIRRDGSSLFGPDARYATYYRISGAYRLNEDLHIPGVQELKVRASVGTAGLRPPFEAQYETFVTSAGSISPGVLGNKNLKPAHSKETEVGFDFDFLNRFSFEGTRSHKVTSDQVLPVPLSSSAGYTAQWRNAGTLEGTTYEASLGAVIANSRDLSWNLNVTFDRTRMKVTQLNVPPFATGENAQSNAIFLIKQGVTYGSMWGYRWDRTRRDLMDNPLYWSNKQPFSTGGTYTGPDTTLYSTNEDGLLILTANHGTVSEAPIRYVDQTGSTYYQIGDANPNFSMSFSTTLSWKGFSVYGLLDWVQGGDIYNLPRQWLERAEFRSGEMDQAGKGGVTAWCKTYDPTNASCSGKKAFNYYGVINDANNFNSWFVENGTYARLRELSVTYSLQPRTIRAIGLSRLVRTVRLSLVGRNVITWTKYTGWDPDTHNPIGNGGDATTFRFDNFSYPNFRTFSGMVEIGF